MKLLREDEFNWGKHSETKISKCYLGKIFFISSGRNAWNVTWSERYPMEKAFHLTFEDAINEIQERRTRGTRWLVEELPVLVITGDNISLCVCEINTDSPLSKIQPWPSVATTLKEASESFVPKMIILS